MPTKEQTVMGTKESARYAGLTYHTFKRIVESGGIEPLAGTKKFKKSDLDRLVGRVKGGDDDANTQATD